MRSIMIASAMALALVATGCKVSTIPDNGSETAAAPGWSAFDATLLRATDELHRDQRISETTWTELSARYNQQQLMDLVFTAGQYTMVSMFLNSAQVQLEPGLKGLPK